MSLSFGKPSDRTPAAPKKITTGMMFGKAVKAKRYSLGMANYQLTYAAKLYVARLAAIESGRSPYLSEAKQIADAFRMPLWELIKESGL
jgi:hypothetical protein